MADIWDARALSMLIDIMTPTQRNTWGDAVAAGSLDTPTACRLASRILTYGVADAKTDEPGNATTATNQEY